ncbi:hypothetical protein CW304_32630 [Bacillus sp. UFRGS-B20]|nr:hypothetical protein CW304_32630 [Bacillus sp. UFRGS-B20]
MAVAAPASTSNFVANKRMQGNPIVVHSFFFEEHYPNINVHHHYPSKTSTNFLSTPVLRKYLTTKESAVFASDRFLISYRRPSFEPASPQRRNSSNQKK